MTTAAYFVRILGWDLRFSPSEALAIFVRRCYRLVQLCICLLLADHHRGNLRIIGSLCRPWVLLPIFTLPSLPTRQFNNQRDNATCLRRIADRCEQLQAGFP